MITRHEEGPRGREHAGWGSQTTVQPVPPSWFPISEAASVVIVQPACFQGASYPPEHPKDVAHKLPAHISPPPHSLQRWQADGGWEVVPEDSPHQIHFIQNWKQKLIKRSMLIERPADKKPPNIRSNWKICAPGLLPTQKISWRRYKTLATKLVHWKQVLGKRGFSMDRDFHFAPLSHEFVQSAHTPFINKNKCKTSKLHKGSFYEQKVSCVLRVIVFGS